VFQGLGITASAASTSIDDFFLNETPTHNTVFGNYSTNGTSAFYNRAFPTAQIEVYDPDGIDTVWFFYKRTNESVGQNQTMEPVEWEHRNYYSGNFEAYVTNRYTDWNIRFYANDSNGIESASEEYILRVVFSKSHTYTLSQETFGMAAIIIAIPIILILIPVFIRRRS
jgi:hypothetical protein